MTPFVRDADLTIYVGDALDVLRELPPASAQACVTSPPYLDARPEYESPTVAGFELIFDELARVVDGPVLVNVGRLWKAGTERLWWLDLLRSAERAGWFLLDTLVWAKPNANPLHGEVFTNAHEYVLILGDRGTKLNVDAVRRPHAPSTVARFGRGWVNHKGVKNGVASKERKVRAEPNPLGGRPRSVIEVYTGREKGNPHPAPMPLELAEHLVKLACWPGETVIDPFAGSGTTALAARRLGRRSIAIEKSEAYARIAARRLAQLALVEDVA